MEAKSGSVYVKYEPYAKASGISIVVSWECSHSSQSALRCLKHEELCDHKGLAETALCYSMVEGIESALIGDPVSLQKNQVSGLSYNALGKHFSVSYSAKGSVTVMARTLRALLKVLKPSAYTTSLASILKSVGQSINAEGKKYVEHEAISSLKHGIHVFVVGKMKTTQEKFQAAVDAVGSKFPEMKEPSGAKKAPTIITPESCPKRSEKISTFKVSGMQLVYLYYYLHNKLKYDPEVGTGEISIPAKTAKQLGTLGKKATVARYVAAKYGKLGDLLTAGTCYFAALSGLSDAHTLTQAAKAGVTVASIEKAITDNL